MRFELCVVDVGELAGRGSTAALDAARAAGDAIGATGDAIGATWDARLAGARAATVRAGDDFSAATLVTAGTMRVECAGGAKGGSVAPRVLEPAAASGASMAAGGDSIDDDSIDSVSRVAP